MNNLKIVARMVAVEVAKAQTLKWKSFWASYLERLYPNSPLVGEEIARRMLRVKA